MVPLLPTLIMVILFADVGVTFVLYVPIVGTSPAPSHVLTPTFHMTLTPTKYDALHYVNGTDASTSASLTPGIHARYLHKKSIDISYDIMCTKLDMFNLYSPT
ncbi:unnamed protein product [Spirodela intermedia]|uniref:Uncharacterized protein n=1 Tax=Spirodela intermedia TaxID=51605 RepID=A0A7I8I7Q0_SPIIN|nr:unnamed protein product [Spirodela intermedia]CAA6653647.1 unnamed protein product [Spirodela intermedia]